MNPTIPSSRVVLALPDDAPAGGEAWSALGLSAVTTVAGISDLTRAVAAQRPAVVLLHRDLPSLNAQVAPLLRRMCGVESILLVDAASRDEALRSANGQPYPLGLIAQAERFGCTLVAAWPPEPGELGVLVDQAAAMALAAARSPNDGVEALVAGRLYAVRGDVDGAGKSEFACNLGALLAQAGRRVALVDLSVFKPSLHLLLGVELAPRHGLGALFAADVGAIPDLEALRVCCPITTGASAERALDLYMGSYDIDLRPRLGRDVSRLTAFVAILRRAYDDIIVDLGAGIESTSPTHDYICAHAAVLFVVSTPLPECVEHVALGHGRLLARTKIDDARCRLIVNRVLCGDPLSPADVRERCGGMAMGGVLPEDPVLIRRARAWGALPVTLPDAGARRSGFVQEMKRVITLTIDAGLYAPQRAGPASLARALWTRFTAAAAGTAPRLTPEAAEPLVTEDPDPLPRADGTAMRHGPALF